jgi:hypothetical protein
MKTIFGLVWAGSFEVGFGSCEVVLRADGKLF